MDHCAGRSPFTRPFKGGGGRRFTFSLESSSTRVCSEWSAPAKRIDLCFGMEQGSLDAMTGSFALAFTKENLKSKNKAAMLG